jgi:hypothetical protein
MITTGERFIKKKASQKMQSYNQLTILYDFFNTNWLVSYVLLWMASWILNKIEKDCPLLII